MAVLQLDFQQAGSDALPGNPNIDHNVGFANLVGDILQIVMVVALLLLLFFLVTGAIQWITSGGDSGKVEQARNKMMYAVIGIIILSASVAVFLFVQYILGIEVLTFTAGG
ncbi:MAG: hypothetical protein COY81_01635 [Candidatus Pacebacteria bacterium CG_4_10_14_0_8_um_filter_43_12]|nr:MAG: hypothetical protein COY81_01635 [Candidatus Pacebacteria bacterium CG_4_10_14_0_8_um_filter_43_12]